MNKPWQREHWLPIPEYEKYEASNLGRIRNRRTGRILRTSLNRPNGYHRVGLDGKHQYVHRLVASAFYDGDIEGKDINHIDGDKDNNSLPNLEICTRQENIQHAFINGLKYPSSVRVVRCKFCKHRGYYPHCDGQPDDFFCKYGER